jgi:hypothetical protein
VSRGTAGKLGADRCVLTSGTWPRVHALQLVPLPTPAQSQRNSIGQHLAQRETTWEEAQTQKQMYDNLNYMLTGSVGSSQPRIRLVQAEKTLEGIVLLPNPSIQEMRIRCEENDIDRKSMVKNISKLG